MPALRWDQFSWKPPPHSDRPTSRTSATGSSSTAWSCEDECAVRLVREREQTGDDPVKTVRDAMEIGARVLDREQAAANAEYVKTEFEQRLARTCRAQFTDKARTVAEHFGTQFDEVFGPETTASSPRSSRSSSGTAAPPRCRTACARLVAETLTHSREDLVRQFSAADGSQPARRLQGAARSRRSTRRPAAQTPRSGRCCQKLAELQKELQALRDEKDKLEEVERRARAGHRQGPQLRGARRRRGRRARAAQGDVAEAVGDQPGATGKTGDVVVAVGACNGPARGRIVFEAKDRRLSKPGGAGRAGQGAGRSRRRTSRCWWCRPRTSSRPSSQPLREYNGDKLLVALDPDDRRRSRSSWATAWRVPAC